MVRKISWKWIPCYIISMFRIHDKRNLLHIYDKMRLICTTFVSSYHFHKDAQKQPVLLYINWLFDSVTFYKLIICFNSLLVLIQYVCFNLGMKYSANVIISNKTTLYLFTDDGLGHKNWYTKSYTMKVGYMQC